MKRIKVLKAYFITWLFILYIIYANADLLGIFFMATVIFSTAIVGLLAVGTLYQIVSGFDIMMLGGTFGALAYKKTGYEFYIRSINSLLPANIAHMLQSRKSQQQMFFTQDESRNIIDWLEDKFRKQKSYINFFINTSMLVGLLGTFVGLVEAIDSMGQIILSLNGEVDIKQIMQDFSGPLSGMAIGFGASLFGVVSAVILGLNGYILFRSQDTLINGIEDWLKDRIIDLIPENMGRASIGTEALPDQRKTFMDVFLEQMTNFSQEVARLSKSHESLHVMSETLLGIKSIMEIQKESLHLMAERQESHYRKFDTFSHGLEESYAQTNIARIEDRALLQYAFENHSKLLDENGRVLSSISKGIANVDQRMENQQQTMRSLVSIGELGNQKTEQMYLEYIETINTVGSAIKHETQTLLDIASTQEIKSDKISHVLNSTFTKLSEIETLQEKDFQEKERMHTEFIESIESVTSAVKHETQTLSEFSTTQEEKSEKIAHILTATFSKLTDIDRKNDKGYQEKERMHSEFLEAIDNVNSAIKHETQTLFEFANTHDEKATKTANILTSSLSKLSEIDTKILHNGESLSNIELVQKSHLGESVKAYEEIHNSMLKVDETIQKEIIAFEDFARMQIDKNQKIVQNQTQAIELFNAILASVDKVKQTLSLVSNTQDTTQKESKVASSEILGAMGTINGSLQTNRTSLEFILESQERFSTQYSSLQKEAIGKLQNIGETVLSEKVIVGDILQTSQMISDVQKNSLQENLQAYENLVSELSKIEELTALYSQERRTFEAAYFKNSTEKQEFIVDELSKKVEITQTNVEAITQSLQNIEVLLIKLDKSGLLNNSKVAGFFSSLFGKN
ncbi:MAG: MotA/TolQ/ExbB proton channel family protein [Campylobacteraceae bacterium]|nr:MotA/TolQ/ExbB proton channel family protein [Campylobacteraceae bacterium]